MQMSFPKPETRPISLDPRTSIGYVHLTVRDLKASLAFYQNVLGFKVHSSDKGTARLGAGLPAHTGSPEPTGGNDLLVLTENPDAKIQRFATGLYHFAILVPSRFELARSLRRLGESDAQLGFGDHIVSEAIYLSDPDGNGIEVYRDRPRSQWYDAKGNFQMGTLPVDMPGVLRELENEKDEWQGLHRDTVLGHMHLKASNVNRDAKFYRDVIGFDEMAVFGGSAAFLSAGGYHHHLGMNSWESANAVPPPAGSVGLQYYTVNLPSRDELERVTNRLLQAGAKLQDTEAGVLARDPSQNGVVLAVKG
jgi:catechol 2,3-dioxygenase